MIKKSLKALLLSLGMLGTLANFAQPVQAQDLKQSLGQDPKVKIGKLPNGLTYYIRPNSKPENKVELRLVINAGSILENDNQLGLAHFLEHMLFNGTKNFPKNELVDKLQSMGVQFGADLNAYTSFDETVYMLPIPTDKPGNLDIGFQILQDWAQSALLTDKDIDEERGVVLEESRRGKGAQDRMQKKFLPRFLNDSRYSKRLPIGKDELLKTFKPQVLRDFYKDWYRPNLMSVIVVGDITTEEAEKMIVKYFSGLTNPKNEKKREVYTIKPYTKEEAMYLTDPEQSNTIMFMSFSNKPFTHDKTVGDYRKSLIENLALSALNQRYQDLTESGKPPFIFGQIDRSGFVRNYHALQIAFMPSDDITTGINALIGELINVQAFGFNPSEIELAKKDMLSSMEKMYNERNTTNSANFVGELQRNFLEGEPLPGIEKEYDLYKSLLPSITIEEVNAAMKEMFTEDDKKKFYAVIMAPEKSTDKVNSDATLLAAIQNAFKQTPQQKQDVVVSNQILPSMPSKGSIVNKTEVKELGATTYELSNGVKVTVKSTDFKSDEIIFSGVKYGGQNAYSATDKINANQLTEIISAMGYGNFTPSELTKALSGKNVSVNIGFGETTNAINGNSDVKGLEDLLQLTYLKLTSPRIDKELADGHISKMKNQLKFVKSNPQFAFIDTLINSMYNNSPLKPIIIPSEDDLNNVNVDRIVDIYKNEFSNADGFHFFIVGNVDEATLLPLLEQYIASLPTKGTTPKYVDNGLRLKSGNNQLIFEKGQEKQSLILAQYYGEKPYTELDGLKITLIADILTIRVIEKLREEMGSIYGGGFQAEFQKDPYPFYTISTQLPTGPEHVDGILKETKNEIDRLKKNGPEQKDLDKVRLAILEKRKEQIKTNKYWAAKLQQLLFEGRSIQYFLDFEKIINSITVEDIKKSSNEFFDGKNSFIGVLNPEKK